MRHAHTVFFILVGFLSSLTSIAQSRLAIGPEIALGLNFYPQTDLGTDVLLSGNGGLKSTYALSKKISISTGIYYVEKKTQYTSTYSEPTPSLNSILTLLGSLQSLPFDPQKAFNTNANVKVNGMTTAHFIEVPLLFNYQQEGVVLFAGPYIGFLASIQDKQIKETSIPFVESLNYNELVEGIGGNILSLLSPPAYKKVESTTTEKSRFNKYDAGLTAGIGYQFKHVHLQVSYSHGFLDYRDHATASGDKVTFKTLRFSIAYLFHRKNKKSQQ